MFRRFLDSRRGANTSSSGGGPAETTTTRVERSSSSGGGGNDIVTTSIGIGSGGSYDNAVDNNEDNLRDSARSTASSSNWSVNEKTLSVVANTLKVEELYKFDSAMEASDQMAAAASSSTAATASSASTTTATAAGGGDADGDGDDVVNGEGRSSNIKKLSDCSVLVSPDGDLLIIPQSGTSSAAADDSSPDKTTVSSTSTSSVSEQPNQQSFWQGHADELGEEYASAVFYGHDLEKHGDKLRNGFSMRGYSLPASTLCVKQTADALREFEGFMEELILTKKNYAVQEDQAVDRLRAMVMVAETALSAASASTQTQRMINYSNYLSAIFPPDDQLASSSSSPSVTSISSPRTPFRVGPLSFPDGSVHDALVALEHYYSGIAEYESNQWRKMTQQKNGTLSKLRQSREQTDERVHNRQVAIQEMIKRVKAVEDHLKACKDDAKISWDKVHQTELKVTQLVETKMLERSRARDKQRLDQMMMMQQQQQQQGEEEGTGFSGGSADQTTPVSGSETSPTDIWNLISEHAASMEDGSFEPMEFSPTQLSLSSATPQNTSTPPSPISSASSPDQLKTESADSADILDLGNNVTPSSSPTKSTPSATTTPEPLPLTSRYEIEEECGLPELRAAAVAADQAVEDAANTLLSVLHNLDTAKRSARLAAESCVVATCNAQAECVRSVIEIERANLNERLQRLDELESVVKDMDVRSDIDRYITMDKKELGGRSLLGDDDDGGVASALAVLNNHIDGDISGNGRTSWSSSNSHDIEDHDDAENNSPKSEGDPSLSSEQLEEAVNSLFRKNLVPEDLEGNVALLFKVGEDKSSKSRSRKSTICYSLNSRQQSYQQIPSSIQFDGLCKVFSAILSGCDCNDNTSVLNAKLLLDLSNVFYQTKQSEDDGKEFLKSRLIDHPIWTKDEFWDNILLQSVGESLSQSGVMSNFERSSSSCRKSSISERKRSEYTINQKLQWHDLKEEERYEAASQVHAVVFAQLGSMVDTMSEMGIGLDRRAAFVRRMSVRNQLPISQRTTLLLHLISSTDNDNKSNSGGN